MISPFTCIHPFKAPSLTFYSGFGTRRRSAIAETSAESFGTGSAPTMGSPRNCNGQGLSAPLHLLESGGVCFLLLVSLTLESALKGFSHYADQLCRAASCLRSQFI